MNRIAIPVTLFLLALAAAPARAEDQVDKTYRSKEARFQITAPADKTWDFLSDERSRKQFLLPVYKTRCVTFFHDIAGKKDMVEVSVTAIEKKEIEFDKFVARYRQNLAEHFADTKIFEVDEKDRFKGKKGTSFKIEGRIAGVQGAVLVLESHLFEHKDHIIVFEVAADGSATREKHKKDIADIEKSFKLQ